MSQAWQQAQWNQAPQDFLFVSWTHVTSLVNLSLTADMSDYP